VDASPICAGAFEKATQFQSEICLLDSGFPAMISLYLLQQSCCNNPGNAPHAIRDLQQPDIFQLLRQ
jgi:hypothetical protein